MQLVVARDDDVVEVDVDGDALGVGEFGHRPSSIRVVPSLAGAWAREPCAVARFPQSVYSEEEPDPRFTLAATALAAFTMGIGALLLVLGRI